jgi:hypothetical protein
MRKIIIMLFALIFLCTGETIIKQNLSAEYQVKTMSERLQEVRFLSIGGKRRIIGGCRPGD